MAYADYAYYTGTYKGKVIPSSAFDTLSMRATAYLDMISQGETTTQLAGYTTEIKNACCAVAEDMLINPESGRGISSESVGGNSVSYDNAERSGLRFQAAKLYLWKTGLLYSGV